jgi:hypothetical protein
MVAKHGFVLSVSPVRVLVVRKHHIRTSVALYVLFFLVEHFLSHVPLIGAIIRLPELCNVGQVAMVVQFDRLQCLCKNHER